MYLYVLRRFQASPVLSSIPRFLLVLDLLTPRWVDDRSGARRGQWRGVRGYAEIGGRRRVRVLTGRGH